MDKDRKGKIIKYSLYVLVFIGFFVTVYFIFDGATEVEQEGLNCELPSATIKDDEREKSDYYSLGNEDKKSQQEQELASMADYCRMRREVKEEAEASVAQQTATEPEGVKDIFLSLEDSKSTLAENTQAVEMSSQSNDYYDAEKEALRLELQALHDERELAAYQERQREELERQKRENDLLQQQYLAMASQAQTESVASPSLPNDKNQNLPIHSAPPQAKKERVEKVENACVSSLDSHYNGSSNGFYTVGERKDNYYQNTLKVFVDRDVTVKTGDYVPLRLMEEAKIGNIRLPRNTSLIAKAMIQDKRLSLHITNVEYQSTILPVSLTAYDLDGQEGIYIPNSDNISAVKEMTANISSQVGSTMTLNNDAKAALVTEVTKGVMKGVSALAQKKLREEKVNLKSGYRLYLIDKDVLKR